MASVITIGDTFVDIECSDNGHKMNLGGACANIASEIALLGGKSSVITKLRDDVIGRFIVKQLKNYNVNTDAIICSDIPYRNIVNFIIRGSNEAEYITYDLDCAEIHLKTSEINYDYLDKYDVLHFGSRAFVTPTKNILDALIKQASDKNKKISYDVNARPGFWNNDADASRMIRKYALLSDYIKMNSYEAALFSGESHSVENSLKVIMQYSENRVIILTNGLNGSYLVYNNDVHHIDAYNVDVVDSVGAGDAYYAVFLHYINVERNDIVNLTSACRIASKISSLSTEVTGTIDAFILALKKYQGQQLT